MRKSLLVLTLFLCGCAKSTIQHPGALNSFDNYAYDTLIVEQAALNQAKPLVAKFPAIKIPLNAAIDEYNTTMAAYKTYHLALSVGSNPDQTALNVSISDLITKVASILKSTGATQ